MWNVNKCSGVVGVFNCQGAGWCKIAKKTLIHDAAPGTLTGTVSVRDVDLLPHIAGPSWSGHAVVYAYRSGALLLPLFFFIFLFFGDKTTHQPKREQGR